MNNPTEKDLTKINEGRQANYTLSNLRPLLEAQEFEAISKFKNEFRSGKLDLSKSLAIAAELCTIEDIKNKLQSKINVAASISNKEHRS